MSPIYKKLGFILMFFAYTSACAQLSFFGDLYIGSEKEVHIAFEKTYFNGGQVITAREDTPGIVSFGEASEWEQLQKKSFVDGVVRIYGIRNFTFPVGDKKRFSLITLSLKENKNFVDVQYEQLNPHLYSTNFIDYEIPRYHYWSWDSVGDAVAICQIYWDDSHNLQQLSFQHLSLKSLEIGLLNNRTWEIQSNHFLDNPFTPNSPVSISKGSLRTLNALDLNLYKAMTFLVKKEPALGQKLVSQVLTPNGDSLNDTWKISGYRFTDQSNIKVYNHQRILVYQFKGIYQNDWNGSTQHDGRVLDQGSYYYTIDLDGEPPIELSGWLYIKTN